MTAPDKVRIHESVPDERVYFLTTFNGRAAVAYKTKPDGKGYTEVVALCGVRANAEMIVEALNRA